MALLNDLFAFGRIADLAVSVMILEVIALVMLLHRRKPVLIPRQPPNLMLFR